MSAHDLRRYLEGMGELAAGGEGWVSLTALTAHVSARAGRGNDELRTQVWVKNLWKTGDVVLSLDGQHVALTPKGLRTLRGAGPAGD